MGPRTDALRAAIDEAWRVFDMPAPATTGVCQHCCMDPAIEADFLNHTARGLPGDNIRDWYFAAYAEGIAHDHVAWLLPRVMEMLADGEDIASTGHEVAFQRLRLTGFPQDWPKAEVACIAGFADALFAAVLDGMLPFGLDDIDSWLASFGEGGIDVTPMLNRLTDLPDDRLVNLLHRNWIHDRQRCITVCPFWADSAARRQVWEWNTSPDLLARMERAALAGNALAFDLHDLIAQTRANDGL